MIHIYKSYKYRLRLSKLQEQRLFAWINTCRAVYNLALETKKEAYRVYGVTYTSFDLMKQTTELRKDFDWVKDVPSDTLHDVIKRMDSAYKKFFKGAGFPKWAKKGKYNSVGFKTLKLVSDGVFMTPKLGNVSIYKDRPTQGEIRRATISVKNNKFYISVLTKQERKPFKANNNQVGIDMGISFFASLSNGQQIANPRFTKKNERLLRTRQKSLSRKFKFSKSWYRAKLLVGKTQEKIANQRLNFIHKTSTAICQTNGFIAVEGLRVANMIKSNLSKSISDVSWAEFFRQIEYKSDWMGSEFVKVDPRYTSQTCSACGCIDKMSRKSQSEFECTECGHIANADLNASKNILSLGLALCRERKAIAYA